MADYAVIPNEEAAKQQAEIKPPTKVPEIPEAPRRAAPGSHPAVPVETDSDALAKWQGQDLIEAQKPSGGSWKLDAFERPVFIADPRGAGGASRPSRSLTEPNEEPHEESKPPGEKPGTASTAGQRGR